MKKIRDLKYGIEYDFDENTNTVSKILECIHSDDNITFDRFQYAYVKENFSEPYESEFSKIIDSL